MSSTNFDPFETVAPSEADARLARESSRLLATHKFGKRASVRLQLDAATEAVVVPTSAVRVLLNVLAEMSRGHAVTLMPSRSELTTQQAADLLGVSRPYVVKLLDEGKMPSRAVGRYRKVRYDDLMAYKQKDDEARTRVLDQLAADAQELGMGY